MYKNGKKWYFTARGLLNERVNVPLFEDESLSQKAASRLADAIDTARAGSAVDPERVPMVARAHFYRMLEKAGHPAARLRHAHAPLSEHVEAFAKWHLPRVTARHAAATRRYIERLLDMPTLAQATPEAVSQALCDFLAGGGGRSHRTHNAALAALQTFFEWCLRTDRMDRNPAKGLVDRLREAADQRRVRRSLTADEVSRLLAVAGERALLYDFAVRTGLRRGELERVRWCDIRRTEGITYVAVPAQSGKSRKEDWVVIDADFARQVCSSAGHGDPRFIFPPAMFESLEHDLELAGIPVKTEEGILDWHALRHTCGTLAALHEPNVLKVQRHMRHSSPTITAKYYVHLRLADQTSVADAFNFTAHKKTRSA